MFSVKVELLPPSTSHSKAFEMFVPSQRKYFKFFLTYEILNFSFQLRIQKVMRLLIASTDGYVYMYAINPVEGGDCTLLKQHR